MNTITMPKYDPDMQPIIEALDLSSKRLAEKRKQRTEILLGIPDYATHSERATKAREHMGSIAADYDGKNPALITDIEALTADVKKYKALLIEHAIARMVAGKEVVLRRGNKNFTLTFSGIKFNQLRLGL